MSTEPACEARGCTEPVAITVDGVDLCILCWDRWFFGDVDDPGAALADLVGSDDTDGGEGDDGL